jgi:hypothetical protein
MVVPEKKIGEEGGILAKIKKIWLKNKFILMLMIK